MKLKLYSKPRGAGDQTSGGRGKLLRATTNLTRVQVLVRETLQNSWDAADLDDWVPAYGVHVYKPAEDARGALTESVFAELPPSLEILKQSLSDPNMHVMEIYDRGTTGLNGPVRASEAAAPDSPNNFNSFVFDIGTTKSDGASGGTFGFGKTATFEVSHAHSVVYWSVCANSSGELEHRLIACTLHEPYDQGGARFTGAHWWGDPTSEEIVPLRGDAAQQLGEVLFKTSFGDEETGTSILVIDPEMTDAREQDKEAIAERRPLRTDDDADLFVDEVVEALGDSAWAKAIYAGEEYPPMLFEIFRRDEQLEVAAKIRSKFNRYAASLSEIRNELNQLEGPVDEAKGFQVLKTSGPIPIRLRPKRSFGEPHSAFFGTRTDTVSGYLHLMLTVDSASGALHHHLKALAAPRNQLCLMRSKAEFVVYYDHMTDVELDGLQWSGVFKPTPECDHHFASSEPPTHDAWTPNTADTEVSSYVVRRTLEQVKEKTRGFLDAQRVELKRANRSVRDVAAALRSFMPVADLEESSDSEPNGRRSTGSNRKRRSTPEISVLASRLTGDNGNEFLIDFSVQSPKRSEVSVSVIPSARTADGKMVLEPDEFILEWSGQSRGRSSDPAVVFGTDNRGTLRMQTRASLAVELEFKAEEFE